jgi:hypothetical protein
VRLLREVLVYRLLIVAKFVGVVVFGGGLVARFLARDAESRQRAIHAVASPGLILVWAAGYGLTVTLDVALTELWILGGLVFSLASQVALVAFGKRETSPLVIAASAVPLVVVLFFMAFRPTWSSLR